MLCNRLVRSGFSATLPSRANVAALKAPTSLITLVVTWGFWAANGESMRVSSVWVKGLPLSKILLRTLMGEGASTLKDTLTYPQSHDHPWGTMGGQPRLSS